MITSYRFGEIVINGTTYASDVIIYKDKVNPNWWRKSGHLLQIDDLSEVIKESPETLIIGTGAYGLMKVSESVLEYLKSKGIKAIVKQTKPACETYNKMSGQTVVAALHLTC